MNEIELRGLLEDREKTKVIDPAEVEESEDQDIAFLIDSGGDYKKRQVRRLAVEPFLRFLEKHGIARSRKFPLNRMVEAWLNYLNVERKLRPTESGVRTIAGRMKRIA